MSLYMPQEDVRRLPWDGTVPSERRSPYRPRSSPDESQQTQTSTHPAPCLIQRVDILSWFLTMKRRDIYIYRNREKGLSYTNQHSVYFVLVIGLTSQSWHSLITNRLQYKHQGRTRRRLNTVLPKRPPNPIQPLSDSTNASPFHLPFHRDQTD